jgi:glutamyl-tRNA reductase
MTLLACGINHHKTPLELREKVAFSKERAKSALQEIKRLNAANEAMILPTCNRVEVYSITENPNSFQSWLTDFFQERLDPYWYAYTDEQAVSHIFRVASGLDSMVLGEPQILGQMKEAFLLAKEAGSIGSRFQRLFQRVFNVSKQVRRDTSIGTNPITIGFATVSLAKRIFTDLSKSSVLLIGAGEIIELTGLHLFNQGIKRFVVASRSPQKAQSLANKVYGHWIPMAEIPLYLKQSDIVVSGTSSELPILGKGAIEQAIKARKHKPIFMVDLAVPRDIEPEAGNLEDIYLYNISDLQAIIHENRQCREAAAKEAEGIIELQARHYIHDIQSLDANHLIRQFKENLDTISNQELLWAYSRLDQGVDIKQVLNQLVHNLVNKFSHTPCTKMKQAAYDGRLELLALARQLLDV